jgi:SAM-dependent methyltransferase
MRSLAVIREIAMDFVGYEALIEFIERHGIHRLEGDLVEIGAFVGGGTAKLARFAGAHGKKVYAIDVFDPARDQTSDTGGTRMADIYEAFLNGRSQDDIYRENILGLDNIVTLRMDSREVEFPDDQRFVFGFVDGNHHPEYVRSDFHLIWDRLVPGGAIGFHDYNFDLPEVTQAIDSLVDTHRDEISEVEEIADRHVILLRKKLSP